MWSPRQSVVVHRASLDDQDDQDKEPSNDRYKDHLDGQLTITKVD